MELGWEKIAFGEISKSPSVRRIQRSSAKGRIGEILCIESIYNHCITRRGRVEILKTFYFMHVPSGARVLKEPI